MEIFNYISEIRSLILCYIFYQRFLVYMENVLMYVLRVGVFSVSKGYEGLEECNY